MKYRYRLIIEDANEDHEILEISGTGATKNQQTCLKHIRRNINSTIKEMLNKLDTSEEKGKE